MGETLPTCPVLAVCLRGSGHISDIRIFTQHLLTLTPSIPPFNIFAHHCRLLREVLGLQDLGLRAETNVIVVVQYRNMCTGWYSIHVPFILGFTTWATENVEAELGNSGCKSCEGKDLGVVGVFSTETNLSLWIKLFKRSSDSSPTKASRGVKTKGAVIPMPQWTGRSFHVASPRPKRPKRPKRDQPWQRSKQSHGLSRFSDVARVQREKINE